VLKLHPSKKILAELKSQSFIGNRKLELLKSLICQELEHQRVDHAVDLFEEIAEFVVADYPK